jgi:hypothetical protein
VRWAQQQRMNLIAQRLLTCGFVNRRDLMQTFGISAQQASKDLQLFLFRSPNSMRYNLRSKRYERIAK